MNPAGVRGHVFEREAERFGRQQRVRRAVNRHHFMTAGIELAQVGDEAVEPFGA